jgi:hypothetical protein
MHNSSMALPGEADTGFGARSVKAGEPKADAAPAFRWWTFAVLAVYTASLLAFCGFVTLQSYSPVDALQGRPVASNPPHLPTPPFKVAHVERNVEQDGRPLRMVCYQVSD